MTDTQKNTRLKVAAIGLGWVTQNRHLPVMTRNPRIDVVGVIDRHPGRARDVAAKFGIPRVAEAGDLGDVDWLDQVDAITIGSAPFSHHALMKDALNRGKHVLTEKPFTMTTQEADDIAKTLDGSDRALCVVHNFQFARSMKKMIADLDAGTLGEVRSLSAVQFGNHERRLPTWCEDLPLGLFYDESPHLLYLLRRLAPAPLRMEHSLVHASTRGLTTPARVEAHYAFDANGVSFPATLSCNFEAPVSEWYVMVFGSKRLGIVDVFRDIYVSLPNDGLHVTSTVLRTSAAATWQHWLQHVTSGWGHLRGNLFYGNDTVFDRFAAAALDGTRPEGIEFDDARAVQRMQADIINNSKVIGAAA